MPISQSNKPVIAISMGDPSGVGPEITLKALAEPSINSIANYIIAGDAKVLKKTSAILSRRGKLYLKKLPVRIIDLHNVRISSFSFGKVSSNYGRASIEYVRKAYELVRTKMADAMVTAPINKFSVRKARFKFPGHTEYLAHLSGAKKFAMMLAGGPLKIILVTRHIPVGKISKNLTGKNIAETVELTLNTLKADFNIPEPKIGVCALNPHGGERGMFGSEEEEIIIPALRKFKRANVKGPIPADALFYDAYRGEFDGVVCLYHDQGLIPFKMVARDEGVNITLGLGFVRTSPDHGTAFNIAGKGKADPRSMEAAIKTAVSMAVNRKKNAFQKRN